MDDVNQNRSICKSASLANGLYLALGWLAAIVSVVRYPFIFGVVGIIMGIILSKNGRRAGMPLIIASILLTTIGLIFNDVFYNYLIHALET